MKTTTYIKHATLDALGLVTKTQCETQTATLRHYMKYRMEEQRKLHKAKAATLQRKLEAEQHECVALCREVDVLQSSNSAWQVHDGKQQRELDAMRHCMKAERDVLQYELDAMRRDRDECAQQRDNVEQALMDERRAHKIARVARDNLESLLRSIERNNDA